MIETERLLLRKPTLDDADDLVAIVGDPEVMDRIGHFVAVHKGRLIGRVGFLVWDGSRWEVSSYAAAGNAALTEIGWTIVRAWWGHGFATEGARAVLDWGRAHGVESLVSLIAPDNARSQSVAKKLGAERGADRVAGRPGRRLAAPGVNVS